MPAAATKKFFVAIDGGGTNTRVCITRDDGTHVAGISIRETVKFFDVGFEESARRIASSIIRAAKKARVAKSSIAAVCIGLAGNGRDSDQRRLRKYLVTAFNAAGLSPQRIRLESDATIALAGLIGEEHGVVLICGTGAIAIGRTISQEVVRVGGWGRLFGDEGSGYWIGREALNAVARELDGRGVKTSITAAVFNSFNTLRTREPRELRSAFALGTVRVEQVAPLVSECAANGDRIARAILQRAADELCDQLAAMHRTYFHREKQVALVLHGSVVEHSTVGALLRAALRRKHPMAFRITPPAGTPLDGAVALLREPVRRRGKRTAI